MRVSSGLSSLALLTLTSLLDGSSGQTCIQNLQEIYDAESQVADVSDPRTYVLCPRRVYNIGGLDVNFDVTGFDKNPPLPIRPNIRYLCGDKGDRNDLCWIADGDVHMDATFLRGLNDLSVENVLIQGFVFINALHHALWASKPGDITFRDCEFRVSSGMVVGHTQKVPLYDYIMFLSPDCVIVPHILFCFFLFCLVFPGL